MNIDNEPTEGRMRGILRRFHEDRAATAMTEFVIVLPIFVFSFSAILKLYRFEELAIQSRGNAFAAALAEHHSIQTGVVDWHIHPVTAAGNAVLYHNSTSSGRDHAADIFYDDLPTAGGVFWEQRVKMAMAGTMQSVASDVELDPEMLYSSIDQLTLNMPLDDTDGRDTFIANDMLGDQISVGSMGGAGGPMSFVNGMLSGMGARPGLAAGIRYGVAGGSWDAESEPFLGQKWRTQSWSHMQAPTRPTSKWIGIGMMYAYLSDNRWEDYNKSIPRFEMTPDTSSTHPDAQQANACKAEIDALGDLDSMSNKQKKQVGELLDSSPNCSGIGGGGTDFISGLTSKFQNAADLFRSAPGLYPSRGGNLSSGKSVGGERADNPFSQ